jgi:hypothetical protein
MNISLCFSLSAYLPADIVILFILAAPRETALQLEWRAAGLASK